MTTKKTTMQQVTKTIIIIVFIALFIQCKVPAQKNIPAKTVVSGKIKNLDVYPSTKTFSVEIIDFRGKETIITDTIKTDGTFTLKFDLYISQDVKITPLVGRIFAHPGDSIHIEIDFKNIAEVKFSGDAQKPNQELYKYLNSNYSVDEFRNLRFKTLDFESCKRVCDSARNILANKRAEFIKETNPSSETRAWINQYINTKYYRSLLITPVQNIQKAKDYANNPQPKDYFSYLDSIECSFNQEQINTDAIELLDLYFFISQLNSLSENYNANTDSTITFDVADLIKKQKNGLFKQFLLGDFFYRQLNQNNIEYFDKQRNMFDSLIHEPFIRLPLLTYYCKLKKDIQNPQIASDAILKKMDKTVGKDLMDSILNANKGKVTYIDCWATWCGPCIQEMPNSRKLMEKYAGKKIEFVYFCFNSKEEVWKLTLAQLQLSGQQYLCNQEQSSAISKGFGIKGIPFYILINKQGNIVDSGNHLRPGNPETIRKIDKLLNE